MLVLVFLPLFLFRIGVTIIKQVVELRTTMRQLFENNDQPLPFVYVHLVHFMLVIYQPLFAYAFALEDVIEGDHIEIIGLLVVFFCSIFMVGLKELGTQLSDPYGVGVHNLNVLHYIIHCHQLGCEIIDAKDLSVLELIADEGDQDSTEVSKTSNGRSEWIPLVWSKKSK